VTANLKTTYVDVGPGRRGATVAGGPEFWARLMTGGVSLQGDWLMTSGTADGDWPHWEMHPQGEEVVMLLSGSADLVLDGDEPTTHELREPLDYVLVPRGTWHRAVSAKGAQMLFLTAGAGTQHRPA